MNLDEDWNSTPLCRPLLAFQKRKLLPSSSTSHSSVGENLSSYKSETKKNIPNYTKLVRKIKNYRKE